ncbi:MAG: hypothetical protein AAGA56_17750 [Myxococcota bacterium]
MADVKISKSSRRVSHPLHMLPFIDLLMVVIAFLLITAASPVVQLRYNAVEMAHL